MLLSLSLKESGVDADSEDRDGRDMAIDLDERSRTWHLKVGKGEKRARKMQAHDGWSGEKERR